MTLYSDNNDKLQEINNTLIKDTHNKSGKIGIFLPGQNGDVMTAMSVLKYKDILWPNKEIIWFCNYPCADVFKYGTVSEVRHYPYPGDGHFNIDFASNGMKTENNKLNLQMKDQFDNTKDLEDGFFPAPWMFDPESSGRKNVHYANIAKKLFNVNPALEWHPVLYFSDEERELIKDFCSKFPFKKTIMLETVNGSGHSNWNDNLTLLSMKKCRDKFGDCNFIFASNSDNSKFMNEGVFSCANFTIRQTALLNNYSDLFIGVSSGISVATSCWGNKPTPKIQYCGGMVCSTVPLANGPISLIECEKFAFPPNWDHTNAELHFSQELSKLLEII